MIDDGTNDFSPIWSNDGRYLFFISNRGGSFDLWRQKMTEDGRTDGEAEPLTSGLEIRRAAFSSDAAKLAYTRGRRVANVWRVPLLEERPATWSDAQQITFDEALIEFVDVSRDGENLLVSSDRAGNQDLWKLPADGGEMTRLSVDPAPDWAPVWSPDQTEILFYSYRSGNRDLWVMPAEGGPARPLTTHPAEDYQPAWSPDGRRIAFTSLRSGKRARFPCSCP